MARQARVSGICCQCNESGVGMSRPAIVRIEGPDAGTFLHSQTTNDVLALDEGMGHLSARVTRTGHLVGVFSLHRLPNQQERLVYLLLTDSDSAQTLVDALDEMLFSDDLTISDVSADYEVALIQGPEAANGLHASWGEGEWMTLSEGGIGSLSGVSTQGQSWPAGSVVCCRSLTGDAGFVVLCPRSENSAGLVKALLEDVSGQGLVHLTAMEFSEVLELLRIEAGMVRMGPDTIRRPLLPETGLEQQAVSYTKGCYLGQEVIARVRTYGSVPRALRGLVLEAGRKGPERALENLPDVGEPVVLADGSKVGTWASRSYSPVEEQPLAFAYLSRDHRTPGQALTFWGNRGPIQAKVVLLPVYRVPDQAARVAHLYDRAIRIFADGKEEEAITLLEEALRLDAQFADGYEAIGVILGRNGKYHEAIDFFRRLEEVAPQEPLVNTNLSLYYMKLGDRETAEKESALAIQKSIRAGRGGEEAGESAAELARAQEAARRADAERKKGMFALVLELDAVDPIALFGMGNAHLVLGELNEAVDALERASEADKNNSAVYLAWGKALEGLERFRPAVDVFQRGMEVASRRGDLMPLKEMEHRMLLLKARLGDAR